MKLTLFKTEPHRYHDLDTIYGAFPKNYKRIHDICGGGGSIILSKDNEPGVLNDYDPRIYWVYFYVKYYLDAMLRNTDKPPTETTFFDTKIHQKGFKNMFHNAESRDCTDTAAMQYVIRNLSLNGDCRIFSPVAASYYERQRATLPDIHKRLQNITIDARNCLTYLTYEPLGPDDIVIIDPPETDKYYGLRVPEKEVLSTCLMLPTQILIVAKRTPLYDTYLESWKRLDMETYAIWTNY